MCDICLQNDEKNILIDIRNLHINPAKKYMAGISVLEKAFGYDTDRMKAEVSPYPAVRDLEALSKTTVEAGLLRLWRSISEQWLSMNKAAKDVFILSNRIFINPKTGKPLTKGEWATIKRDVLKAFDYIYASEEERIALHALSLGRVIKGMSLEDAVAAGYTKLKDQVTDTLTRMRSPEWQSAVTFAQQHAAENIVELKQTQFKKIHDTVQTAIKNRANSGELQSKLFDTFGDMNRDWRRIAETEIGNAQNNGQLITELENRKDGDTVFMKGMSAAGACPWCARMINHRIVVLLDAPPVTGDEVSVNGMVYTAIWPGKDNVGRKRADWWVSSGVQHPHAILPGQEITSALPSTAMEGFYEGRVIKITTESGSVLSVTENHPVLTPFGFVKAKFLCEGVDVLKSTDPERMMKSVNPYNYQGNILIEDFYRSAKHSSGVSPVVMPSSSEYLHGDGRFMNKTINIVNTYGLLGSDLETKLLKLNYQRLLDSVRLRFGLSIESGFLKRVSGSWFSSLSDVGITGNIFPFLRGAFGHSDSSAFRNVSDDDAVLFDKSLSEGGATHSDLSREFIYRFSGDVSFDESLREFSGITWDSPSFLVPEKISHIETSFYTGSVYDITDDIYGLYTCNGIVVKNCACTWVRHIPGFEKWDKKVDDIIRQAMERGAKMQRQPDDATSLIKPTPWNMK